MGFPDDLKLEVKRRTHFQCCLCKALYVEVHHIIPEAEDGPNSIENAAPLCPSCHETYGANPTKRKFIREARDSWYEICVDRFKGDNAYLEELHSSIESAATRNDLNEMAKKLEKAIQDTVNQPEKSAEATKQEFSQLSGMIASTPMGGVSAGRHCKKCNTSIGLYIGDQGKCPECGTPW